MKLQLSGGTTRGKDHLIAGKNNHDAYVIKNYPNWSCGVVCDGCGSGSHSEVGAKLAAEFLVNALYKETELAKTEADFREGLVEAEIALHDMIYRFAKPFGERSPEIVSEYFLFTCFGFVYANGSIMFFNLGDGYIIINGEVTKFGPFANNAPPYFGYRLLKTSIPDKDLVLKPFKFMSMEEVDTFLIGTDGLDELIDAEETPMPNKKGLVGPISQFWTEDKFFFNPFSVARTLLMMNGGIPKVTFVDDEENLNKLKAQVVMDNGVLYDDTTLIVGRKNPQYNLNEGGPDNEQMVFGE